MYGPSLKLNFDNLNIVLILSLAMLIPFVTTPDISLPNGCSFLLIKLNSSKICNRKKHTHFISLNNRNMKHPCTEEIY